MARWFLYEHLEDLASEMGCLAIYKDEDIEGTPLCELPTVIEALAAAAGNKNEGKS